jgi:hypothetical protein
LAVVWAVVVLRRRMLLVDERCRRLDWIEHGAIKRWPSNTCAEEISLYR